MEQSRALTFLKYEFLQRALNVLYICIPMHH
jgi:hypothetical protein